MSLDPSFVLVDKPASWTSHDVVGKARTIFGLKKIGHAGTLDPMATGLVVLGLGRATRLLRYVQGQPKEYVATAMFGVATDSLDADGAILDRTPMEVDEESVAGVLARFTGAIMQVPPMVSALKIDGKRLYELAREGKEVERQARPVTIWRLEIEAFAPGPYPEVSFRIACSTGTYVRTLADDIARALGGRGHLTALRRVRNGALEVRNAWSVDELIEAGDSGRLEETVIHPSQALSHLSRVQLPADLVGPASHGQRIPLAMVEVPVGMDTVQAIGEGRLIGVYRVEGKQLVPEVVLG